MKPGADCEACTFDQGPKGWKQKSSLSGLLPNTALQEPHRLSLGVGTSPSSAHAAHGEQSSSAFSVGSGWVDMHSQVCQATGAVRQVGDSPWWSSRSALEARP